MQTCSSVLDRFQNASRFRNETKSKNSLKKLATPEENSQSSDCPNSKAPENYRAMLCQFAVSGYVVPPHLLRGLITYQSVPCQLGHRCLPKRGATRTLDQPVFILLSGHISGAAGRGMRDVFSIEYLNQCLMVMG